MGIADYYCRIIRRELEIHAAWKPITNVFALGDFGVMSDGKFWREGNLSDLGVTWDEKPGPPSKLNFSSASVTSVRVEAGVKVDVFSEASVDAELRLGFKRERTLVLNAVVTSREIDDIFKVDAALRELVRKRPRFRFVKAIYTTSNPLILASRFGDTQVTIKGEARALKQIDLGKLGVGIAIASNKRLELDLTGKSGTIGLGLARVKRKSGLASGVLEGELPQIDIEEDTDWDNDPADDD